MDDFENSGGISADEKKTEKYEKFCDFLIKSNERFNLTAIKTKEEIFVKHFTDSLSGAEYFKPGQRIIEIGSGGGFPSVPLKINEERLDFVLIEATAKKCGFLNEVKNLLGFKDFEVMNIRAEEGARTDLRESFDIVTARAVAKLNILCELCLPYLKTGGKAVFYKNYGEEIDEAKIAISLLGGRITEVNRYNLPGAKGERCHVVIEKTEKTDRIYPREYKKIIKYPL